jgi:hypothetical protein
MALWDVQPNECILILVNDLYAHHFDVEQIPLGENRMTRHLPMLTRPSSTLTIALSSACKRSRTRGHVSHYIDAIITTR